MQGIHTLPELAEVKSVVARITKPDGWVVLNADDKYVARIARRVRASVAFFTLAGDRSPLVRRHLRAAAAPTSCATAVLGEADGDRVARHRRRSPTCRSCSAAWRGTTSRTRWPRPAGARAMGASLESVRKALRTFVPTTDDSPGRLNIFRDDHRVVVVDFAHNEAGVAVLLDVVDAIARGGREPAAGRRRSAGSSGSPAIVPTTRCAASASRSPQRVDRFVQKEMLHYLRGRTRESVLGEIRAGALRGRLEGRHPGLPRRARRPRRRARPNRGRRRSPR